jgi:hypothetical protein
MYVRRKKSPESLRVMKLSLRLTPRELSFIDEIAKKWGYPYPSRSLVIRGIIFEFLRANFSVPETPPDDIDFARLLRPENPDTFVKSEIIPAYPTSVVSVASRVSVSSSADAGSHDER